MKPPFYKTVFHSSKHFVLFGFMLLSIGLSAQHPKDNPVNLDKIPPRIIRACCAFGYDLKLWGVPFVNIDQVISIDDLGDHHYMGHKSEGVGTIYTHKGGFIDIGHLRDQLDWTRYVYRLILDSSGKGEVILPLRNEAGRKTLFLNVPAAIEREDAILLAGKITYDLSLWHEISTWFGASAIPLVSEKFSSFSVEDQYSNLLGIHVGMKTLQSELPFNTTATKIIATTLDSLAVVKTAEETYEAYDAIHSKWYTNKKRIPRTMITLKRDPDVLLKTRPWLVTEELDTESEPVVLKVPLLNTKGASLTSFYQLVIEANRKINVEEILPNHNENRINQDDFGAILKSISDELKIIERNALIDKN